MTDAALIAGLLIVLTSTFIASPMRKIRGWLVATLLLLGVETVLLFLLLLNRDAAESVATFVVLSLLAFGNAVVAAGALLTARHDR